MKSAITEAAEELESLAESLRESARYDGGTGASDLRKFRQLRDLAQRLRAEAHRQAISEDRLREVYHQEQFGLFCDFDEFEQIARHIEHMLNVAPPPAVNKPLTTGWRPIETAPKDGTQFIAVEGDYVGVCAWHKTSHIPMYGFHFHQCDPEDMEMCDPTHWMPLPAPPVSDEVEP